jgi:uncharacterized repeat protein (TIGR03803 family)
MKRADPHLAAIGFFFLGLIAFGLDGNGQVVAKVLHNFGDASSLPSGTTVSSDATSPAASLVLGRDGNFYGVTSYGGTNGTGTAFSVTPQGVVTILHSFGASGVTVLDSQGNTATDGTIPQGGLIQGAGADTHFYGTTANGGANGVGTAFSMTPAGTVTILHNFGDSTVLDPLGNTATDGVSPRATLVLGADGNYYGTTSAGGSNLTGTVFSMTTQGVVTILHNFGDGTVANDGANPCAPLIQGAGADTNFYGTAPVGGAANAGIVFSMTPAGVVTVLHSFGGSAVNLSGATTPDGVCPMAALLETSDGNFYGTTIDGGTYNSGTAFKMTPSGAVTVFYQFGNGTDGSYPASALAQYQDGNFYGTSQFGGSQNFGTVFQLTSAGVETLLHQFGDGSAVNANEAVVADGTMPRAGLAPTLGGNFYGVTLGGGAGPLLNSSPLPAGTFFKVTAVGGPTADFEDDGVPNLLKEVLHIDPSQPMGPSDLKAMPELGMVTGNPSQLTLTWRQNASLTGVTVAVQSSLDLKSWQTIDDPVISQISTDATTGDPILQTSVPLTGTRQFIRLNVTQP